MHDDADDELDAELHAEIWAMFRADAPQQMAAIAEAWTAGDLGGIARLTHRLAGDSGAAGCGPVELCARDLERAAAAPGAAAVRIEGLVRQLEHAVASATAA